ncbi:MAG: hypothetical protein AMS25_10090 [Gemmatimonas sp. SM23_52]|nr:MAG: hypothetical protein AMS25_10090 [Gemmatimonas sp. SM23_52]
MSSIRISKAPLTAGGFAIPAAVFVIVVLSLLALGGLYVAQNNATANAGIRRGWEALYAADAGAAQVMANWDRVTYGALSPGDSVSTGWRTLPDGSLYQTFVLRVDEGLPDNAWLYRLRTVGRPGSGISAQRTIVTMMSVARATGLCCEAAIKARGLLDLRGTGQGVKVSGLDEQPPTWSGRCEAEGAGIPGIRMQDTTALQISGDPVIEGSPPLLEDTSIDTTDFNDFGELTYDDLARMADKKYVGDQNFSSIAPVISDGTCVTSASSNWGDPLDPDGACWDYVPVIHVGGDMHVSGGGYGQGILLIDGDLLVTGNLEFYGVVVVQGEADFRGTTSLTGGLMVRNGAVAGDETYLRGGTTIQYSSCSTTRALSQAVAAQPLAGRHWFEVLE